MKQLLIWTAGLNKIYIVNLIFRNIYNYNVITTFTY